MNRAKALLATIVLAAATVLALSSCATAPQKAKVNVLIVPKFELGHMAGDHVGEAQLFFEGYCAGCDEIKLAHATPTTHFFLNEDTGVGLLVTGAGKSAAALSLSSVLSCDDYDFSDTTIVSVGCAGGSTGTAVFGDVAIVTAACDNELGHHADSTELSDPANEHTWFPDDSYAEYDHEELNAELAERAWRLVRDCPLQTTERARQVLEHNFPEQAWALRDPCVLKGTAVTGDSYWKGADGHRNAVYITEYHECPDPYAVCEMEEVAIMNAAECFGLEDRVISLRVVVNLDTFLEGESPEGLWASGDAFDSKVVELNSETVDIFDPAMHNLYDVTRIIIDALLANEL